MKARSLLPVVLGALASLPALVAVACSATGSNTTKGAGADGQGASGSGANGQGAGNIGFDAGEGGNSFGDAACGSTTTANQVPGSLLIVLDRSGSMSGGDGQPDKWGPTKNALKSMMAGADDNLSVGLSPFPKGDFDDGALVAACGLGFSSPQCQALMADGGCQDVYTTPAVPVGPLSTTEAQIAGWLDANGPSGNTPTFRALEAAYAHLGSLTGEGERFVLLVTDGEPTTYQPATGSGMFGIPESNIECKELSDIEAAALAAASGTPSIKTFVIGSPGSEGAADFLSQVAVNGQTAELGCDPSTGQCHFQIGTANFEQDLAAALALITGTINDCVFQLPTGDEIDPGQVNVKITTSDGSTIDVYKDTSHQDGWDYGNLAQTQIVLYGPACEAFKNGEDTKIDIVLGCQTVTK